ncbi:hypothetical protein ABRY23_13855 [Melioribacteraceae bacterium 4301-Me]|uniref:hypothetical protein n=1 Tax=Pyranulibacter aquaticus TaxID=3163344 RepID=UPI0035984878
MTQINKEEVLKKLLSKKYGGEYMKGTAYVKKALNSILDSWIQGENGEGMYKYSGGYWEVLLPLFKKYVPEKLKSYENMLCEEFDYTNERVRKLLDSGDEEQNVRNAIKYINYRIDSMAGANDFHYIEDENGEDIPYIPNMYIDINDHFDREYDS